jgi:hypothetical protein
LTALRIARVGFADTSSNSSSSGGSALQLPLLQELDFYKNSTDRNHQHVCLLLHQASALSKLKFFGDCCSFLDSASGVITQLPSLQHIELKTDSQLQHHQLSWDPEAAHLAALTSSSQLTLLELSFWELPAGAVQQLFPAGRQLQRLQELYIGCRRRTVLDWNFEPGDISCIVDAAPTCGACADLTMGCHIRVPATQELAWQVWGASALLNCSSCSS